jgi:UDP-GlcNAc:undecaprenyl-phosphate/decaprenyl-phosphate GlcNAc-1-phosphate transferase
MQSHLAIFVLALVASLLLTPAARRLALSLGAVGTTGGRNVHARVIPRLGGVALTGGWSLSLLLFLLVGEFPTTDPPQRQLFGVVLGGLILCVIGAVDDVRGLRAVHKLMAQVLVAVLAYGCGFRIEAIALPFMGPLSMGVFALPVTVIWIVGITNAVNLIDGLDGLAAGVCFFAALTSFVVAYVSGNTFVALLLAALMGVLAGFLFFNFNPARIFMGDSGSYFLGYVLASLSLTGALQQKASTAVSLLVPMIALGLPIFDTLLAMLRRFLERRSMFAADRGHIHHRLLDLGLTHRRAVIVLYGVCVVFTASAIAVSLGRTWQTGVALLSVSIVLVGLVRFVGYFEYLHLHRRQKVRLYDEHTETLRRRVPELLFHLHQADNQDEVFSVLKKSAEVGVFERFEIEDYSGVVQPPDSLRPPAGERDLVRATYPIGPEGSAHSRVRFLWQGEEAHVSPAVAILLQLLVDAMTSALERCGSPLVPSPLAPSVPVQTPAVVPLPSSTGV